MRASRAFLLSLLVWAPISANAMGVCTTSDATRVINQLQNQELDDKASVLQEYLPSYVENPMRKATITSLAKAYCLQTTDADPISDRQEQIEFGCTMYSGVYNSSRVYWTSCPAHTATFSVKSISSYSISVVFYAHDRPVEWPGNNMEYVIKDHDVHTYSFNCKYAEKICYGAWYTGNAVATAWGVGHNRSLTCTNCCYVCGATSEIIQLGYVPGE